MIGRLLLLLLGLATAIGGYFLTCGVWQYREVAAGVAWLEPKDFETLTMITVGTGSAYENPRRMGPATAIGLGSDMLLVDAGRGISEALRFSEIPPAQPTTVLLTSLLPENTVGLDDLLVTGWMGGRSEPLRVLGPRGTSALVTAIEAAHAAGLSGISGAVGLSDAGRRLEAVEVGDGFSETRAGLQIRAAAVGEAPLPQLAWRFDVPPRSIVVSGAGPDPEKLLALASGAWVLVVEGFHDQSVEVAIEAGADEPERLRREAGLHLPLSGVGDLASRAGVLGVILTRLRPPPVFDTQFTTALEEDFSGRVVVAGDGDIFTP